jgi:hypothetical protein
MKNVFLIIHRAENFVDNTPSFVTITPAFFVRQDGSLNKNKSCTHRTGERSFTKNAYRRIQ